MLNFRSEALRGTSVTSQDLRSSKLFKSTAPAPVLGVGLKQWSLEGNCGKKGQMNGTVVPWPRFFQPPNNHKQEGWKAKHLAFCGFLCSTLCQTSPRCCPRHPHTASVSKPLVGAKLSWFHRCLLVIYKLAYISYSQKKKSILWSSI